MSAILIVLMAAPDARAQMDNQPFNFKNSTGGIGMSVGGKQAIINDKLFRVSPDNILRGPNGQLLTVTEGPGESALVQLPSGEFIPNYHGTSWRSSPDMSAGTFNAFFSPVDTSNGGFSTIAHIHSGATVSTWTTRVASNTPVSFLGENNSVDTWTGQTYTPVTY